MATNDMQRPDLIKFVESCLVTGELPDYLKDFLQALEKGDKIIPLPHKNGREVYRTYLFWRDKYGV